MTLFQRQLFKVAELTFSQLADIPSFIRQFLCFNKSVVNLTYKCQLHTQEKPKCTKLFLIDKMKKVL